MKAPTKLDPQQQEQAERIYQALMQAADADLRQLAELLASKPDRELLDEPSSKSATWFTLLGQSRSNRSG